MSDKVLIELVDDKNIKVLSTTQVPITITRENIQSLSNLENVNFYLNGQIIQEDLKKAIESQGITSYENIFTITTQPNLSLNTPSYCSESYSGHEEAILCILLEDNLLVTGGGDCTVRFWCLMTKTQKKIMKDHTHWVLSLCMARDLVVSGGMDGNMVFYTKEGNFCKKIKAHEKSITSIKYSNEKLYSCGRDMFVKVWNLNGSLLSSYSHLNTVTSIIIDKYLISCGRDGKIIFYSENNRIKELPHPRGINCIDAFGDYVVAGGEDGSVCIYNNFQLIKKMFHQREVISISISKNGLFFASGSFDKKVRVWGLKEGNLIGEYSHLNFIYKVIALEDSIISCSKDKTIKVYKISQAKVTDTFLCGDEVFCMEYLNNNVVAGCKDKRLYFFN